MFIFVVSNKVKDAGRIFSISALPHAGWQTGQSMITLSASFARFAVQRCFTQLRDIAWGTHNSSTFKISNQKIPIEEGLWY